MELADGIADCDKILGPPDSDIGDGNRKVLARLQYLDFLFIPLYVAFFVANALLLFGSIRVMIITLAVLTGVLDFAEDFAILALGKGRTARPVRFGAPKWFFYFVTVGLQALVVIRPAERPAQRWLGWIAAIILVGAALGGVVASLRKSFAGISSATMLSLAGLLGLGLYPIIASLPFPVSLAGTYIVLERVPLLFALVLIVLLPLLGKAPGLLDVTPLSMLAVSLAATACGEAIAVIARLIFRHASDRINGVDPLLIPLPENWFLRAFVDHNQVAIMLAVSLPLLVAALLFDVRQHRNFLGLAAGMVAGLVIVIAGGHLLRAHAAVFASGIFQGRLDQMLLERISRYPTIFAGYASSVNSSGLDSSILTTTWLRSRVLCL